MMGPIGQYGNRSDPRFQAVVADAELKGTEPGNPRRLAMDDLVLEADLACQIPFNIGYE